MARSTQDNRMITELTFRRVFEAPRELVWKAWTVPEIAMRWWGPRTFTAPVARMDVRPGGKYLICMRGPDGKDYWSTGTYREVAAPERLVITDSFADAQGNVVPATYYGMNADFPLEMLVTMTFEETDGKTRFTLKYHDVSSINPKDLSDMQQGWNESFDKLEEVLKEIQERE